MNAQPSSWQTVGIGGGGALFSPSINPANPQEMYVGCDMTELFHTTNQGASWTEKHFQSIQGGSYSQMQFTQDPNIRYCINHAAKDNVDRVRPFKTDDNGATWYPLIAPINEGAGIVQLYADYNSPSRVVLVDYYQIFFSTNGGGTFTKIFNTASSTIGNHIAGVCFDGSNIYICTEDGIYQSTDNGANWSWMTTTGIAVGEKILSFTWAKTGTALKFVCMTATRVWAGIRRGSTYWQNMHGMFKMSNADGQWTPHHTTGLNAASTDFVAWLGMAQNDTSTIYAAGGDNRLFPIVMKSVNSQAWTHTFFTANNQNVKTGWAGQNGDGTWDYGSAPQGFQVCPTNSNIVITSDLGFMHLTTNGGTNWKQIYLNAADENPAGSLTPRRKNYHSAGLENTAPWHIAWLDEQNIMAGCTDIRGIISNDGGSSWHISPILDNSTYRTIKLPNGKVYAGTSTIHDLYQSTRIYDSHIDGGAGKVYVSSDNAVSFSVLHDFAHPVVWIEPDTRNPSVMYASVLHSNTSIGGIYKTANLQNGAASTWTKLPNPTDANGHPFNIFVLKNGDLVATYSARVPTPSDKFTPTSGVFYFSQASQTWSNRSHPNMRFWTKDITVDPADPTESTWYVASFQGWGDFAVQGTGGLYKTKDKGLSWARISTEFRVNSATVHPRNPNLLYYTTETNGLWYSTNATAATPTFSRVESYPFRHPLRVFFNPYNTKEVWVTSFGNGIKIGYDPSITSVNTPATPSVRGLYVDDFKNILGNTAKENAVLAYAQAKNFNYLALYELHHFDFNNATRRAQLASFIRRAKTTYGIAQVAATGEIASFFQDRILIPYQNTRTDALEKFDVFNLEFEFWSPVFTDAGGYYCTTYLQSNGLPCNRAGAFSFYMTQLTALQQLCTANNLICETEFGWFTQAEANQFVPLSDRILVHAYVPTLSTNIDPSLFYNYTKDRLGYIGNIFPFAPKPVMVILSSEPDFSGPWLNATVPPRHPQAAFDIYKTYFDAESASWKTHLSQVGFQWFTYSMMPENGAILPVELLDFQGFAEKQGNRLMGQFADLKDLESVEIFKSKDGKNFIPLSKIPATSGSSYRMTKTSPTFVETDKTPYDLTYYQLKINDVDGKTNLSKVISIKRSDAEKNKIKLFPNPTQGILTLISDTHFEDKKIEIVNTLGQVVLTQNGLKGQVLNIQSLENGVYFLKIGNEMVRFVKN